MSLIILNMPFHGGLFKKSRSKQCPYIWLFCLSVIFYSRLIIFDRSITGLHSWGRVKREFPGPFLGSPAEPFLPVLGQHSDREPGHWRTAWAHAPSTPLSVSLDLPEPRFSHLPNGTDGGGQAEGPAHDSPASRARRHDCFQSFLQQARGVPSSPKRGTECQQE